MTLLTFVVQTEVVPTVASKNLVVPLIEISDTSTTPMSPAKLFIVVTRSDSALFSFLFNENNLPFSFLREF